MKAVQNGKATELTRFPPSGEVTDFPLSVLEVIFFRLARKPTRKTRKNTIKEEIVRLRAEDGR